LYTISTLWDIQKNIEVDVKEVLNIEEIKNVKKRNNFDPIVKETQNIPYLVDQHLLDKNA